MSKRSKSTGADLVPGSALVAELGRVQMLPGEDPALFEQVKTRVLADVQPRDVTEELYVIDFIYYVWEAMRYRRYKTNLLRLGGDRTRAMIAARSAATNETEGRNAAAAERGRMQDSLILGEADTSLNGVLAQTLASKLELLGDMDHLQAAAETRRTAALRELYRHRNALGERAQQVVQTIEDAEFKTIACNDEQASDEDDERLGTYVGP